MVDVFLSSSGRLMEVVAYWIMCVLMVYLSIISTIKLFVVRRLDRTIFTHSQRIAAILALVAKMPDPPPPAPASGPVELAARKARVYCIAQEAMADLDEMRR